MSTQDARYFLLNLAARALILAGVWMCADGARGQCPGQWLPGEAIAGVNGGDLNGALALARLGNGDLIVGGDFLVAGNAVANSVARWDGNSFSGLGGGLGGSPFFPLADAVVVMPNGDVVVGGNFTSAGGVSANYVARWNGSAWSPLGAGLAQSVAALAVLPNGDLVAGTAGGSQHVFRWDGSNWTPLGAGTNGSVAALTVMPNGDLIAGGAFTTAGGVNANYIARWDGTVWWALGAGMDHPLQATPVQALAVMSNGDLVAGGVFSTAGGTPAANIARWDGTAWSAMGAGASGSVTALKFTAGLGLVGAGGFFYGGGGPAYSVARWDGTSWSALGSEAPFLRILAMEALDDGTLVAAGNYWGTVRLGLARWDGSTWSFLGTGLNGPVQALAVMLDGDLVVGGDFTMAPGIQAQHVARRHGSAWSALGGGITDPVVAVTARPNGDIVAGSCNGVVGAPVSHVAAWNGTGWIDLAGDIQGELRALATLHNGDVVAGGTFTQIGGVAANYVARWDGSWHPLGGGLASDVNVLCVLANGNLVAGGSFNSAGLVDARGVARWDGSAWSAIGAGVSTPVRALCERPNGEIFANEMRWDGSSWSLTVPGLHFQTDVKALAALPNGDVIAAGNYTFAPGVAAMRIAGWNGSVWYPLGTGMNLYNYGGPWALAALPDGDLEVGGSFSTAGGLASGFLARWSFGTADFDHDGDTGTDADIVAFFECLSGNCCPTCGSADFNADGDVGTDADIESFFRVLSGGSC